MRQADGGADEHTESSEVRRRAAADADAATPASLCCTAWLACTACRSALHRRDLRGAGFASSPASAIDLVRLPTRSRRVAAVDRSASHKLPLDGAARAYHAAEAGVAAARPCLAAVVAPEPEKKHRAAVWAELD